VHDSRVCVCVCVCVRAYDLCELVSACFSSVCLCSCECTHAHACRHVLLSASLVRTPTTYAATHPRANTSTHTCTRVCVQTCWPVPMLWSLPLVHARTHRSTSACRADSSFWLRLTALARSSEFCRGNSSSSSRHRLRSSAASGATGAYGW